MVVVDAEGKESKSPDKTFTTKAPEGAIKLKGNADRTTIKLTEANKTYILTEDIISDGTGIEIAKENITLDLDGHKVSYINDPATLKDPKNRKHGILISASGAKIKNGVVEQRKAKTLYSGRYGSYALASFGRAKKTEVCGMSVTVSQCSTYPLSFINSNADLDIHHNYFYSTVNIIYDRHYPGNDIIRADVSAGENKIHHNICYNGPHKGISLRGSGGKKEIFSNDIKHDQGYVNGYAINCGSNLKVYNNRITSNGRGMHIAGAKTRDVEVYENYFNLTQSTDYDNRGREWRHYYGELHGIKLENCGTGVKVHHNKVIATQPLPQPDEPQRFSVAVKKYFEVQGRSKIVEFTPQHTTDRAHYSAATPLNFHFKADNCNAMVEVYKNEFVAITKYKTARPGRRYGRSGEWAAGLRPISAPGECEEGKYTVYIHDNIVKSNDTFVASDKFTKNVRIEKNKFILIDTKENPATTNKSAFRGNDVLREVLKNSGNTFEGMGP